MLTVPAKLKQIRESIEPRLTIRAVAEALGYGENHNKYAYYEDEKRFRKDALPLPLAKQLADIFENHGIDRDTILSLGGVDVHGSELPVPAADAETLRRLNLVGVADVSISFAMGDGSFVDVGEVAHRYFDREWLQSVTRASEDALLFARGVGDSMLPTIHEDDAVLINTAEFSVDRQDKVWAFAYGGLGMIKRLRSLPVGASEPRRYLIISDNPAIENFEATEDEIAIRGRVVWIGRRI